MNSYYLPLRSVKEIKNLWEMESVHYFNYIQWIPRELLEELIPLISINLFKFKYFRFSNK